MNKIWTPKILLPSLLTADPRLDAARVALENQLKLLSEAARECFFLPRLDELPEAVLDLLAEQYHVDFYEPLGMSIDTKREYIRDAIFWHRIKGTPAAVSRVMGRAFNLFDVEEWWQYGGDKYFFRIPVDINSDDEDAGWITMERVRKAVHESKNARSWLDYFVFRFAQADPFATADDRFDTVFWAHEDSYDYRRAMLTYDGSVSADGTTEYVSFQAADFERLTFDADIDWHQPFETRADNLSSIFFTLRAEHQKTAVELDYVPTLLADQLVPVADAGSLAASVDASQPVDAADHRFLRAEQALTFDGSNCYDGLVVADGSLVVEQTDQHPELERWQALKDDIAASFDERCERCGGSEYTFGRSSVRLGDEHFLLSDPQWLTVQIRCRNCGTLIAEYILEDNRLEVRL